MFIATKSYSIEDRILGTLAENYHILIAHILVSKYPILALAKNGCNFFLVEYLSSENNNYYIAEHLQWFYAHLDNLKSRFHISSEQKEKVLFITSTPERVELSLPDLSSEVEILLYNQKGFTPFRNYVINLNLYYEFLHKITIKKLNKKVQLLVDNIIKSPPLICRKKSNNYLQILTERNVHHLYFVTSKILYHQGPAPFSPVIISV